MSKKAFDKIKEGLDEAIAVARSEASPHAFVSPAEAMLARSAAVSN